MASISTNYYGYSQNLFSSTSSSSSTSTSTSNPLGDYMSIKNGSYKKLLKAYYKKQEAENGTSSNGSVSTEDKKLLLNTQSSADSLTAAANELSSMTSFEDKDELVKSVNEFVKAYNSTIDSSAKQDTLSILRKTAIMTSGTKANSNMLSKIGITIGSDNKLTVNETKLKAADAIDLSTMFDSSSFMGHISSKATDISSLAVSAASQGKLYGVNGKFSTSMNTSVLINSLV